MKRGDLIAALRRLEHALAVAEASAGRQLEGRIRSTLGYVLADAFRDTAAFLHFARAAALFRETGDVNAEASVRITSCFYGIILQTGDVEEELHEILARAEDLRDRWAESAGAQALAMLHYEAGHLEHAERFVRKARALARKSGLRYYEGCLTKLLASVLDEAGEGHQAHRLYEDASALFHRIASHRLEGITLVHQSGLVVRQGDVIAGKRMLERGKELLLKTGDSCWLAVADLQQGQLELAQARSAFRTGQTQEGIALRQRAEARIRAARGWVPGREVNAQPTVDGAMWRSSDRSATPRTGAGPPTAAAVAAGMGRRKRLSNRAGASGASSGRPGASPPSESDGLPAEPVSGRGTLQR